MLTASLLVSDDSRQETMAKISEWLSIKADDATDVFCGTVRMLWFNFPPKAPVRRTKPLRQARARSRHSLTAHAG